MKALTLLFAAVLLLAQDAFAQGLAPGPQVLTFFSEVDDTEQPYGLYLPPDFDASRRYPLVVSLHGAGSNHRLNLRRVFGKSNAEGENDVEASRYFPKWEDVDFIVATPFARGTMGYQGVAEKDVLDVLADVRRRFPVDEDRIYLTGLSMGGGGTLWLGLTRPDLWAAIAPVCPAPPPGAEILAPNALNLPVHLFTGGADPVVRPEGVRAWVERLKAAGADVEYEEYPGVGHDSWVPAYADGQIFDWFAQFRRNAHPDTVHFVTSRYAHDGAYWVQVDALTPGTPARIDAAFAGPNRIEVTTSELDGFTLRPAGHPRFTASQPATVRVDGTAFDVPAGGALAFSRTAEGWTAAAYERPEGGKGPGAEGPVGEAVAGRHLYVYGTAGESSGEALQARRQPALKAATWSIDRGPFWGRVMVFPRVVADVEVRPSDFESANLVLFGTAETNTVIAQLADRLPLHFTGDGDDYGLVYVYPVDGRYVLVSSGLPWWQKPEGAAANPFVNLIPALDLGAMPDFLLFEGAANNAVVQGRFDRAWQLAPADAEALEATGVVVVKAGGTDGAGR